MKKFILAFMSLVVLASCSHNFEYYSPEELVTETYNQAFTKAYGPVAPSQTWGFGSTATSRGTRALPNDGGFEFPNDADASKFLSDVPSGVEAYADINYGSGYDSGISYIDENLTKEVNIWGRHDPSIPPYGGATGGTLYVKGNCDFSNRKFYFAGHSELYLVRGATLTLNASNAANLQEGTMIYVAEGAKIVTDGELKLNKGLHIYNHGTIEAETITTNSESVLYNVGTVTVNGQITVENEMSVFVNDGTLTAKELLTKGSGKVQNNGDATIEGTTTINSNNNTWVNNGHYVTEDFKYTAGSTDVKNNCKLTVKNEFFLELGDCNYGVGFYLDGGVVANSFTMEGPGYIYMHSNSVFKVETTAVMNISSDNDKYGIYGIGNDWAVFQADKIVAGTENQKHLVSYNGKLAVVANTHFAQAEETDGNYPYYITRDEATLYVGGDVPSVTIEESECNPGFVGDTTPQEPTWTFLCRVFGEDLSATQDTDFDFNDVVFDVYTDGNGTAKVILLAAGGTLPLSVDNIEIHDLWNQATTTMINTGEGPDLGPVELGYVQGIYSLNDVNNKIKVVVFKNGAACEMTARQGQPCAKFAVTEPIKWVSERVDFSTVYTKFKQWVNEDADYEWYKTVENEGKLY